MGGRGTPPREAPKTEKRIMRSRKNIFKKTKNSSTYGKYEMLTFFFARLLMMGCEKGAF